MVDVTHQGQHWHLAATDGVTLFFLKKLTFLVTASVG